MAKAPVVTELPLQSVRFLFGTMVDLRMLPQVLEQTGRAEVGEFKLVAHFPEQEKASGNEAGYMTRHKGFRGGDYNTYHGDPYTLDEIKWDATGRAGVHLVTKTKYGQTVEFPTIPDKNDTAELMLIVSEYVESIKTPPLIVRCSGIGGTVSPLGNKKYALSLTTGATKCPTKIKDHVPKKYHAEDMDMIPYVGGAEIFSAEDLSPSQQDFIGQQIARQMQGYYRTGVIGIEPVIGAFPNGPMSIAKRTPEAKQDFFREPAVQDEDGFWNKGPNRWQAHKIAQGVAYDQLERAQSRGTMLAAEGFKPTADEIAYLKEQREDEEYGRQRAKQYEESQRAKGLVHVLGELPNTTQMSFWVKPEEVEELKSRMTKVYPSEMNAEDYAAESLLLCSEHDDYFNACGCGTKTMNAPYAGRGSLMDIGKDTGLGSFTPGELTTSSAIHGDFDQASLNYSGHQNLEVRSAEHFAAASTAVPNLKREKTNLRSAIRDEIDSNFEYSQCVWGPYALRMEGANTNKFYMVFVYDNGNGVFRALGGYGGLAQNPRLFDVMTTRDRSSAIAAATRKLKAKERKGYFTYNSEEGNAPIQDPMEFGEMANWTPLDGSEGLKRKRAENQDMMCCGDSMQFYEDYFYCPVCETSIKTEEFKQAENIPVWNDGIVQWETSGSMSPTGSGYSSASAPPTGVIAGPGDTFLNYTEAQNYLVETSGGLWGAEHFEAMARIDPKNAQDVKKVKDALKKRYQGIKINRIEYITNRRGASNKYHVFAFTNRGVFNGYGRIGKTMTLFGPMTETQGQKKMDTKMRRGGYKEQV